MENGGKESSQLLFQEVDEKRGGAAVFVPCLIWAARRRSSTVFVFVCVGAWHGAKLPGNLLCLFPIDVTEMECRQN